MTPELKIIKIDAGRINLLCTLCTTLYDFLKSDASFKTGYDKGTPVINTTAERTMKLEDTVRDRLERILNNSLPEVTIHRGGQGQENLRAAGAYALTKGTDIYIREESYQEGTELTDQILIHELTHVQQLKKKKIKEKEEIAEAEKAAEQNERLVQHQEDPCFRIEIDGQQFYLNKKTAEEALYYAAEELKNEVSEAYSREDIIFLAKLQKVLEEGA
jgi:glutamate synthase domain-containing protein 1